MEWIAAGGVPDNGPLTLNRMPAPARVIFDLLYIQGEALDPEALRAKLLHTTPQLRLHQVSSSREALLYLRRSGKHAAAPLPDIIVLDLQPGDASAFEFLQSRSSDPFWRVKPVLVLTSDPHEVATCYELRANACLSKPGSFERTTELLAQIGAFWCKAALLPPPEVRLRELLGRAAADSPGAS